MSRFSLRQQADMSPTHCRFCGEYLGPFLDTGCEEVNYGRIWVCAPIEGVRGGCVGSMAAMCGWHTPGEYEQQQAQITALQDEIEALNSGTYSISLGDLSKMAANGSNGDAVWVTDVPAPEPPYYALDDVVDEPPEPPSPPDPEDLTKDALITRAREMGIKPANKAMTKGELQAAIAAKED